MNPASMIPNTPAAPPVEPVAAPPVEPVAAPPVDPVAAPPVDPVAAPPGFKIPENWKDAIPEEFRSDPSLQAINDFDGLVKSYVNGQRMIGADKIVVPHKHDDGTLFREAMVKLGLPKEAAEYKINFEGETNSDLMDTFKNKAYELGILPNQAEGVFGALHEKFTQIQDAEFKEYNDNLLAKQANLKEEWGEGYEKNISLAEQAIRHLSGDDTDLYDDMLTPEVTGNPSVVKLLMKVGAMLQEDDLIPKAPGQWGQTPEEIQKEINSILANKDHPYNKGDHPNHEKSVLELQAMYKKLG